MLPNGSSPCLTNNGLLCNCHNGHKDKRIEDSQMFVTSSGKWTVSEAEGKFDNYGVYG